MAAKKTGPKPVVGGEDGNYGRTYFRLAELHDKGFSVEQLLDLGANRKLALSFLVAEREIVSGEYLDDQGNEEANLSDVDHVGPVRLLPEYVWQLIAEGKAVVTYLFRVRPCNAIKFVDKNEGESSWTLSGFSRFQDSAPLPVVKREDVVVTAKDWERFQEGLPPIPAATPKAECPNVIAVLSYMYAECKKTNPEYFDQTDHLKHNQIANDILAWVENLEEPLGGMGKSSVYQKVKDALENVTLTKKKAP